MDKKNTMLLTVIAVATLLVAVVGATFAYFSVSSNTATATTVNTTVGKVGTVALTGGASLEKTITAAQMAQSVSASATVPYSLGEAVIAKATLENAGTDETYFCTLKMTVTNESDLNASVETDGGIALTVASGLTFVGENSLTSATRLNPMEIADGSYTINFKMGKNATVTSGAELIKISGVINNEKNDSTQATRLADKKIDLTYAIDSFSCDTSDFPA